MSDTPAVAPTLGDQPKKTPLDVLRGARALVELPEHWTQETLARDYAGRVVPVDDPLACSFCMGGAIDRISSGGWAAWYEAVTAVSRIALRGGSVAEFNDTHTHAEILAAFDKAIASLEQQS